MRDNNHKQSRTSRQSKAEIKRQTDVQGLTHTNTHINTDRDINTDRNAETNRNTNKQTHTHTDKNPHTCTHRLQQASTEKTLSRQTYSDWHGSTPLKGTGCSLKYFPLSSYFVRLSLLLCLCLSVYYVVCCYLNTCLSLWCFRVCARVCMCVYLCTCVCVCVCTWEYVSACTCLGAYT